MVVVDTGVGCSVSGGLYGGAAELNILEDDTAGSEDEIVVACLLDRVSFMLLVVGIVVVVVVVEGMGVAVPVGDREVVVVVVALVVSCRGFVRGMWVEVWVELEGCGQYRGSWLARYDESGWYGLYCWF